MTAYTVKVELENVGTLVYMKYNVYNSVNGGQGVVPV